MMKLLRSNFRRSTVRQPEKPDKGDFFFRRFPGPLMREKMQKENLIRFIEKKSETCLSKTKDPDHVEEYFFWQIMELFCRRNGKVMTAEVGALLVRLYGYIRQKLRDVEHQKEWCLPMARLFCSAAPNDENRKAVIEMGDDLAARGLTYAAHICYVVAKVELGSRAEFSLIGCKSTQLEETVPNNGIMRTETYEYVLSLTSGLPQLNFQIFKFNRAIHLDNVSRRDAAFAYCETISRTVITFPRSFSRSFVEQVVKLSCSLSTKLNKEPEWLLELRNLCHSELAQANLNFKEEQEKHVSSASPNVDSGTQDTEHGPMASEIPTVHVGDLQPHTESDGLSEFCKNILEKDQSINVFEMFAEFDKLGKKDYTSFHAMVMSCFSEKMSKKDLIQLIKEKSKECVCKNYEADHVEDCFFWQIMELFCRRNGKVRMAEVGALLLRFYTCLEQKLRDAERPKDWCLPLARLLCSTAPDDEHRQAVINMGDYLASRGLTYAAHICYVVAKVELGSRAEFDLIGYKSMPLAKTSLDYAVVRTEAYEYVLSLTSGLPQPNFQIFKLCNAGRLAMHADEKAFNHPKTNAGRLAMQAVERAFDYCESVARAVITLPSSFSRTFVGRVVLLSDRLLKKLKVQTEPEWLLELRRLHSAKAAEAKANGHSEPQQRVSSTSPGMNSDDHNEIPTHRYSYLEQQTDPKKVLKEWYTFGKMLGEGGFGLVYAATRKKDGRKVAIKFTIKEESLDPISIPGETEKLPVEVALMKMVSRPPCSNNIVKLLEWFDFPEDVVMVMERPSPCMDLTTFIDRHNGRLSEAQTRDIMLQVISAARHCTERGVFHRDIKALNLLITTATMEVKLIDFGCGNVLKDITYMSLIGTPAYLSPETLMYSEYKAIPSTIWGLGILLYDLVYGKYPFALHNGIGNAHLAFPPGVSREFFEMVMWCLEFNPELRPTLEDLNRHEWFTKEAQDKR